MLASAQEWTYLLLQYNASAACNVDRQPMFFRKVLFRLITVKANKSIVCQYSKKYFEICDEPRKNRVKYFRANPEIIFT